VAVSPPPHARELAVHPGAWLLWSATAALVAVTTTNPFYLVPLAASAWLIHAAHGRPERGSSFSTFAVAGAVAVALRTALVLFGPLTADAFVLAALEGLRVAVLLMIYGALNSASQPQNVLRLAPRRFYEPALVAALALTIAPRTIATAARVREAQKMRGIRISRLRALPALAVPVLETGMEEAVMLAESMDARGHGRGPRSRYRPQAFNGWSWATTLVAGLCTAVFLVHSARGLGDLVVAAYPLAWPEASGVLVLAAFGFAFPALLTKKAEHA
jgi:energy-coupling factor transport system permease protein